MSWEQIYVGNSSASGLSNLVEHHDKIIRDVIISFTYLERNGHEVDGAVHELRLAIWLARDRLLLITYLWRLRLILMEH